MTNKYHSILVLNLENWYILNVNKPNLKCRYQYAHSQVIGVRIAYTRAQSRFTSFSGCCPASALSLVGSTLDQPASLPGRRQVADRGCVWVALPISTCIIIIIVIIPIIVSIIVCDSFIESNHWLVCLNSVLHWVHYEYGIALVVQKWTIIYIRTL